MRRVSDSTQQQLGDFTSTLDEIFKGVRTVKSYNREAFENRRAKNIIDNLFRLYWQPIEPAYGASGSGTAMEVLVRLANEQGQELSPAELVRAAERYRLMGLVDRWVLQTTFTSYWASSPCAVNSGSASRRLQCS